MSAVPTLKAPFPYFGGKRRVATEVWRRFGSVRSYVEPFFGSGAVLLARPQPFSGVETVNDLDGLLCNFWRALQADPGKVAKFADWPVSECDLHARHLWLVERREDITGRLMSDPDWFDAQAAGWWVWGACSSIGDKWCLGTGPWVRGDGCIVLGDSAHGIFRQLPHLSDAGQGVNRAGGVAFTDDACNFASTGEWFAALAERLRRVRITCGSWDRVTGDSVLDPGRTGGPTGVFLDPPYDMGDMNYGAGGMGQGVAGEVRAWALEAGKRADLRIALCGYDEHDELAAAGWSAHRWKTKGGYSGGKNANQHREVVWFSPHCIGARQPSLLDMMEATP